MQQTILAFNETKTVQEWLKDPRCKVKDYTLKERIKEGWEPEKAISHNPYLKYQNPDYLIGERFGRLIVVEYTGKLLHNKVRIWKCLCDCGNFIEANTSGLKNEYNRSCGCLQKEAARKNGRNSCYLGYAVRAGNWLLSLYKKDARKRGLVWELTSDEFFTMNKENCYYCGQEPSGRMRQGTPDIYIYNGIDRVDNDKGYFKENCVACCKYCNFAKSDLTTEDFFARVNRIYNIHIKNKENGGIHTV